MPERRGDGGQGWLFAVTRGRTGLFYYPTWTGFVCGEADGGRVRIDVYERLANGRARARKRPFSFEENRAKGLERCPVPDLARQEVDCRRLMGFSASASDGGAVRSRVVGQPPRLRGQPRRCARHAQWGERGAVDLVYVDPPFRVAGQLYARGTPRWSGRRQSATHARVRRLVASPKGPGPTEQDDGLCDVPRDARAQAGGDGGACSAPDRRHLGRTWTGARPTSCASCSTRYSGRRRLPQRDRRGGGPATSAVRRERAVRAHAGHARGLRRSAACLSPPTRLEPVAPARFVGTRRGGPFTRPAPR